MGLSNQNFEFHQGEDKILEFTIEDADDLTGASALWRMAPTFSSVPVLEKPGTVSGTVVTVTLDSDDTLTRPSRLYKHQLRVTDAAGKRNKVAEGDLVLKPIFPEAE